MNKSSRKTKLLKSKNQLSREELANLMDQIASRLREGTITLGEDPGSITFDFPENFKVSIEVEDEWNKARTRKVRELELEIEWLVDDTGAPVEMPDKDAGFKVS